MNAAMLARVGTLARQNANGWQQVEDRLHRYESSAGPFDPQEAQRLLFAKRDFLLSELWIQFGCATIHASF